MPLFELRTRETIECVYAVTAANEDAAVERLNKRDVKSHNAGIVKSDLTVLEISDKNIALSPCA